MCLREVTRIIKKPTSKVRWVWKYFVEKPNGTLGFCFVPLRGSWRVPTGKWLKAKAQEIVNNMGISYQSGFHAYPMKVCKYNGLVDVAIKVKVRRVRTFGIQGGKKVLVADEMFVPTPRKKAKKAK